MCRYNVYSIDAMVVDAIVVGQFSKYILCVSVKYLAYAYAQHMFASV